MSRQKGDIMREVMISIKPRWVELIASGNKTIEVRKTRPKCETPFKCYIYCTNWKDNTYWKNHYKGKLGKVIGEFVCDRIDEFSVPYPAYFSEVDSNTESIIKSACLKPMDIHAYNGTHQTYGWHITDLVVYDEPRELSEFYNYCNGLCFDSSIKYRCVRFNPDSPYVCDHIKPLKRPPQSWCYIEPRQTAD